jgi:hypothetical protein
MSLITNLFVNFLLYIIVLISYLIFFIVFAAICVFIIEWTLSDEEVK